MLKVLIEVGQFACLGHLLFWGGTICDIKRFPRILEGKSS